MKKHKIFQLYLYATLGAFSLIGTSCSDDDDKLVTGQVTDVEGNVYATVTLGTQTWMSENLKVTQYNNGSPIALVTDATNLETLETGAYTWYDDNKSDFEDPYGALYNWYAIDEGNVCPTGWHVPGDEEWTTLTDFLGGEDIAGGKLKEAGTEHWNNPNTAATNASGFTALPGGYLHEGGTYHSLGNVGHCWSSSEVDADLAWDRYAYFQFNELKREGFSKKYFFSVRCVKD